MVGSRLPVTSGGSSSLSYRLSSARPLVDGPSTSGRAHPSWQPWQQLQRTLSTATAASLTTINAQPDSLNGSAPVRPSSKMPGRSLEAPPPPGPIDGLPSELLLLLEPSSPVQLPPPQPTEGGSSRWVDWQLDNWKLDKLVSQLGRSKATWRRALLLFEWLKSAGHVMDDRLCTTVIRLSADNGDVVGALAVYEWMRAPRGVGGAGLRPTPFTYTAVMRAAIRANLLERGTQVWSDAEKAGIVPDCRMCTVYMEACTRLGQSSKALAAYALMQSAPPLSALAPSVHAYVAAMRAACEGGRWKKALGVWADLKASTCPPNGHAYAAVIHACAAGCDWEQAVSLFEEMVATGITPDVVSCTALINALATAGQADKAEAVVKWMLANGLQPNVRTYTALIVSLGNAKQWDRAMDMLYNMRLPEWGGVQPNAYTHSVLLKALGEHGQWRLAEAVFGHLEQQLLAARARAATVRQPQPKGSKQDGAEGAPSLVLRAAPSSHPLGADSSNGTSWSRPSQLNGISVDLKGGSLAADGSGFALSGLGSGADGLLQTQMSRLVQRPLRSTTATAAADLASSFTLGSEQQHHDHILRSRHALEVAAAAPTSSSSASYGGIQGRESPVGGWQQQQNGSHPGSVAPLMNEFVCGALMLAYERAGMWAEAVSVIGRSRALGLRPNTIMFNTGISAAGKAGQLDVAERLFAMVTQPDAITHETLVASYGMCGRPEEAEAAMQRMRQAGFRPRCYAYCGLIAAHSLTGDFDSALAVRQRMQQDGGSLSVHVYNALLAACERAGYVSEALNLLEAMKGDGVQPNGLTQKLMTAVGKAGVESVEGQQAALAAISAAVAAAGSLLIHRGVF